MAGSYSLSQFLTPSLLRPRQFLHFTDEETGVKDFACYHTAIMCELCAHLLSILWSSGMWTVKRARSVPIKSFRWALAFPSLQLLRHFLPCAYFPTILRFLDQYIDLLHVLCVLIEFLTWILEEIEFQIIPKLRLGTSIYEWHLTIVSSIPPLSEVSLSIGF